MYVVYQAYDDNTAEILDIGSYGRKLMTEQELIIFGNKHDVLGLSVSGHKINYITAYNCLSFSSEEEANEYIKYNNLSYQNKRYMCGYWWVFEKKNNKIHVDYYVCNYKGEEVTYVGEDNKGKTLYTPYIQAAKSFDKKEAGEKAALMRKNSKTGTYWTTQRVVVS